jgi:hypothetical protein
LNLNENGSYDAGVLNVGYAEAVPADNLTANPLWQRVLNY